MASSYNVFGGCCKDFLVYYNLTGIPKRSPERQSKIETHVSFEKSFQFATIWDQPRVSSSIRLEVMVG